MCNIEYWETVLMLSIAKLFFFNKNSKRKNTISISRIKVSNISKDGNKNPASNRQRGWLKKLSVNGMINSAVASRFLYYIQ
jgi:hypothetical protein